VTLTDARSGQFFWEAGTIAYSWPYPTHEAWSWPNRFTKRVFLETAAIPYSWVLTLFDPTRRATSRSRCSVQVRCSPIWFNAVITHTGRTSAAKLVRMIFSRRTNRLRCKLAQVVQEAVAWNGQLCRSRGQSSRSHDGKDRVGNPAEESFWTAFGWVGVLVQLPLSL